MKADLQRTLVGSATVPLGRPLGNSRVYILNGFQEPVGRGVVGEIYIAGFGVSRGYLNGPDLTSERFLFDKFGEDPMARMYRSGDQGRYLPDGSIEFLGRVDDQVKIRGFRIELGEIESVLGQHPAVRQAIALARESAGGEKQLVVYVVGRDDLLSVDGLKDYLRQSLPGYMVPSSIVILSRMPLTSNGKVDRASLFRPPEDAGSCEETVAPRTSLEQVLAEIWCDILHRDAVGVLQGFFELGGHSLLATQVISRIRETFQIDVPLIWIFEAPTIASFADRILLDPLTRPQIERMADLMITLSGLSDEELQDRLGRLEANSLAE